jgi:L-iditol 2-dehydrogenase
VDAYEKLLRKQLTLKGSWSFQLKRFPHHAWERSADALARKLIDPKPLITHRLTLDELLDGIRLMDSRDPSVGKIIVTP